MNGAWKKETPRDGQSVAQGSVEPFGATLARHGLELLRGVTHTLQVNVGLLCNQQCRHCHLEAGPGRSEVMDRRTMDEVIRFVRENALQVLDITGGAPEMNPNLAHLIRGLSGLAPRMMVRSNLTALEQSGGDRLMRVFRDHGVIIVASLPSTHPAQADAQRGSTVLARSIEALRKLNELGYGRDGSGLELNLVSNPVGAFLPLSQAQAERKFRKDLEGKWGVLFNRLHTFANVPLGRFRQWLLASGNFHPYMERLAAGFNPCTVEGLMCRTLLSVSWDGHLFDCDFNQASGLFLGGRETNLSRLRKPPEPGTPVVVSDHCYACTAGTGFT
jgi:radical SAM/Cys-rich protein